MASVDAAATPTSSDAPPPPPPPPNAPPPPPNAPPTASSDAPRPDKLDNVVFSYQGSFGPPTYGHYKSMEAFAQQLSTEYSGEIKMYFMMSPGGSKTHLFPTQEMRRSVLQMFCDMLMSKKNTNESIKNKNITFEVGNEEIEIANGANKSIGTIETIDLLSYKFDKNKYNICLGMGLDNAYQLPYWAKINEYVSKVFKIYVIPRKPSEAELKKTLRFTLKDTAVEMQFDITVPWKNDTFLNCFLPSGHTETKDGVNKDNLISKLTSVNTEGGEPYRFFQDLPPVVELTSKEPATSTSAASASALSIPATSSSMMRYFIGQYLQGFDRENNLTKIQKLMFGPGILIEDPTGGPTVDEKKNIVMETITGYTTVFNRTYPEDDKVNSYNEQYGKIEGFSGGNRKTKRRRTNKKRRSQRKKRRSQRK